MKRIQKLCASAIVLSALLTACKAGGIPSETAAASRQAESVELSSMDSIYLGGDYSTEELLENGIRSNEDYAVLCDYKNITYNPEPSYDIDTVLEGIYYDSPVYLPVNEAIDYGMKVDFTVCESDSDSDSNSNSDSDSISGSFLIDELGLNEYYNDSFGHISGFVEKLIGRKAGEETKATAEDGRSLTIKIKSAYKIEPYSRELITDDYVKGHLSDQYGASTKDELISYIKGNYIDKDTGFNIDDYLNIIWEQSSYVISEKLLEKSIEDELSAYEAQAEKEGVTFDEYWSKNVGEQDVDGYLRPIIENELKSELMMEELIKELSVELKDEEFQGFLNNHQDIEDSIINGSMSISDAALLCAKDKVIGLLEEMYDPAH